MNAQESRAARALHQIEHEERVKTLRRMAADLQARGFPALSLKTSALAQAVELQGAGR